MKNKKWAAFAVLAVVVICSGVARAATAPTQPPQPTVGYGSTQYYVSTGATKSVTGDANSGTRVWWFVPNTLKNGSTAPVIIYLHGFQLADPQIYQGHIDHLTRQGYIVIFPQFNKGGLFGILSDTNQNVMLQKAIDSTNVALNALGSKADRGNMHLFGHSLGGLMAGSWVGKGGPSVLSATLANPSLSSSAPIKITPIDHATAAKANTARTIIITGDKDTIAKPAESLQFYAEMINAPAKVVYQATSDNHGAPEMIADHVASIQDASSLSILVRSNIGGKGVKDTLDYRVYFAALDAALAGQTAVPWSMGTWSDGVAVNAPTQLKP